MSRFFFALSSFFVLMTLSSVRAAEEQNVAFSPGAKKEGFYATISTGRFFFTDADRTESADGWLVGLKLGYDFLKYVGIEGQFKMSAHESNLKTVTTNVEPTFFGYQFVGLVKGAYPITKRLYVGGGIGGGVWYTNPNQKLNRGSNSRSLFLAETTIEYFLRSKGLSIGLDPSIAGIKDLKSAVIQFGGYIRHTF